MQLVTQGAQEHEKQTVAIVGKLLLRKRSINEIVNDQLKNTSQIEHSAIAVHLTSFVNLIAGLVAYTLHEKKPSLNVRFSQALPAVL